MSPDRFTTDEMMTVAAARELTGCASCFVGIGLPSTAANLARSHHAKGLILVYESGTIGAKPTHLPLSIGDGELAETADLVVSVPEIFNYWLQPGRIDVGMLGAAQVDRFGNLNSTVIGRYDHPAVRLPGSGGAPEIAAACPRVIVVMRQSKKSFVETLDFRTTVGFADGFGGRAALGQIGDGPQTLITDIGIFRPDPKTSEMTVSELHPGRTVGEIRAATGWDVKVNDTVNTSPEPTDTELRLLRNLTGELSPAPKAKT
ncbi:MAG: CoA-transferase [Acidimicrobiales bacterium]